MSSASSGSASESVDEWLQIERQSDYSDSDDDCSFGKTSSNMVSQEGLDFKPQQEMENSDAVKDATGIENSETSDIHSNIKEANSFFANAGDLHDLVDDDSNRSQAGRMFVDIVGQPRMGKSALIKTLEEALCMKRGWYTDEDMAESESSESNSDSLMLCAEGVVLHHPNSSSCIILRDDKNLGRSNQFTNENDLNCCIYALPPSAMSPLDESYLLEIAEAGYYDIVLPVICKADTMYLDDRKKYVKEVMDLFGADEKLKRFVMSTVLAVVCEERHYSFGSISPFDPEISQIEQLCDYLESHIQLRWEFDPVKTNKISEEYTQASTAAGSCLATKTVKDDKKSNMLSFTAVTSIVLVNMIVVLACCQAVEKHVRVMIASVQFVVLGYLSAPVLGPMPRCSLILLSLSILLSWYLLNESHNASSPLPVDTSLYLEGIDSPVVKEDLLNISKHENMIASNRYTISNLSNQLKTALAKMSNCQEKMNYAEYEFESNLMHLNNRLEKALELCGSWCAGV